MQIGIDSGRGGIRSRPGRMWRWASVALLATVLAATDAGAIDDAIRLPDLGDPAESALSAAMERQIGAQIMREIHKHGVLVDDLIVQEYLSDLGHRLVSQADSTIHDFTFFLVNDPVINAYAFPGGFVGVNAGLILSTENESELAAVVAHEISHVTQRHLARAFFHAENMQGPFLAAMVAAILLGGEAGRAAMVAANAGMEQSQINFTRKNEQEADRVGIHLLARAGHDPDSMATLFEKMHKQARLYGGAPPEFLSSHPVFGSRIADARARAARYPRTRPTQTDDYRIVRARLQILMHENHHQVAKDVSQRLAAGQSADPLMDRYVYAMALMETGDLQQAAQQADRILRESPAMVAFHLLRAEIALRAGQDQQALDRVSRLLAAHPDHHVITLEYARLMIQAGQGAEARKMLEDYLQYRSGDPRVYRLLSHASKASGDSTYSHVYMAEHDALVGETEQAIAHLEAAVREPIQDYYLESSIQAKLKGLRQKREIEKQNEQKGL